MMRGGGDSMMRGNGAPTVRASGGAPMIFDDKRMIRRGRPSITRGGGASTMGGGSRALMVFDDERRWHLSSRVRSEAGVASAVLRPWSEARSRAQSEAGANAVRQGREICGSVVARSRERSWTN
ncbi:uncharacterized protein A4U43_C05F6180 [Asparagus officinalis]|uniref:Uncharacterized protein n=1 Tax=Asparagus officinalis TaxID=4686 RepID=A0A5P1EQR9_ASPOF|nr:uncharacterized protein A4U43_C05F6180 [Asparagus officinalis]